MSSPNVRSERILISKVNVCSHQVGRKYTSPLLSLIDHQAQTHLGLPDRKIHRQLEFAAIAVPSVKLDNSGAHLAFLHLLFPFTPLELFESRIMVFKQGAEFGEGTFDEDTVAEVREELEDTVDWGTPLADQLRIFGCGRILTSEGFDTGGDETHAGVIVVKDDLLNNG